MVIPRWTLLDWRYCATAYYLHVWCQTDINATLIMRHTGFDPLIRKEYPEDRGHWHEIYELLFPKEWRAIKQNPPFDTPFHTFTLLLWPAIRYQWILFHAVWAHPISPSHNGPFKVFFPPYPVWETLFPDPFNSLPCSV